MFRWWHRWRYRVWAFRYLTAMGRIGDLRDSPNSLTYRFAQFDLELAQDPMMYHWERSGLAVDQCNGYAEGYSAHVAKAREEGWYRDPVGKP